MSIQIPIESVTTFTNLCSLFLPKTQARGRGCLILFSLLEVTALTPIQFGLGQQLSATKAICILTKGITTQLKQWETNSAKVYERLTRLCHSLERLLEENLVCMGQAWSKLILKTFCNIFH